MRKLKSKRLISLITVLAFMIGFSSNVFAYSNTQNGQQVLGEKKYTSTIYKFEKSSKSSDSNKVIKRYASSNFEVSSYSDLKSKIAYILSNRITDVNLHITYKCGSNFTDVIAQQIDGLWDKPPVDEYTATSITSYDRKGDGYDGDFNLSVKYTYVENKSQVDYVDSQVKQILSQIIKPGMSDLEKEKAIHDYIVSTVAYDETSSNDEDIKFGDYNAVTKHIAVCEGYSLLAYKMLTGAGIEARIVISNNNDDEYGHAWNMVKIGGAWYHLDCTFDDPVPDVKGKVLYNYFNKTDNEIAADSKHQWDRTKYPAATTKFDVTTIEKPSIYSVTLSKNGVIDVETSGIKDNVSVNFALVHEDGSDASKTYGIDNFVLMDDNPVVSEDGYIGKYFIPDYVTEGNYKIKVTIGDVTSYSDVISVKRDSQITVNNLEDGYVGSTFNSTLTGNVSDKDGINYLTVYLEDADGNYVDLSSGDTTDKGVKVLQPNSDGSFSQSIPALDKIKDGKYTITLMAFDSNGFETSRKIDFTKTSPAYDWQKILNSKPWKTKYSGFTELNTLMNVTSDRKFTIKFSGDADFSTLKQSNIQIIDAESGAVISSNVTKLTNNSAQIAPTSNLTAGRVYYVVVNKEAIKSASGNTLKNGVVFPFKVAD